MTAIRHMSHNALLGKFSTQYCTKESTHLANTIGVSMFTCVYQCAYTAPTQCKTY